jgi:hypothetical protein
MNTPGLFQGSQWLSSKGLLLWGVVAVLAVAVAMAFMAPQAQVPAAQAAAGEVLIFDNSNEDGGTGVTQLSSWFSAAGKTPVVVNAATWGAMTTAEFAA